MTDKIKQLSEGLNHTAISIGKLDSLLDFSAGESKGKVFLKEALKATGAELSFQLLPAAAEIPFFHSHKQNEELYIIIKGKGQMQVDENTFHISEGSVIRIAPAAKRIMKSAKDSDMIFAVLQIKENSLEQWSMGDGVIEKAEAKWLD